MATLLAASGCGARKYDAYDRWLQIFIRYRAGEAINASLVRTPSAGIEKQQMSPFPLPSDIERMIARPGSTLRGWKNRFRSVRLKESRRMSMRKPASSTAENLVSIRVPKKLAGKKLVLVDAAEYAALKRRLAEIGDALEKITRGDAAYRQGRTKTVSALSELNR